MVKRKHSQVLIRFYEDELKTLDANRGKLTRSEYIKSVSLNSGDITLTKSSAITKVKTEVSDITKPLPLSEKRFCPNCVGVKDFKQGKCIRCKK